VMVKNNMATLVGIFIQGGRNFHNPVCEILPTSVHIISKWKVKFHGRFKISQPSVKCQIQELHFLPRYEIPNLGKIFRTRVKYSAPGYEISYLGKIF
jgi:hypothetical protein